MVYTQQYKEICMSNVTIQDLESNVTIQDLEENKRFLLMKNGKQEEEVIISSFGNSKIELKIVGKNREINEAIYKFGIFSDNDSFVLRSLHEDPITRADCYSSRGSIYYLMHITS